MNPRTIKGQRKVNIPPGKMRVKKKERARIQKDVPPSCDEPGCGCGN
ncbi:MAG: hypothetical protein L7R66_02435 [Candidatus Thalassarchaeaceae archaeon]|nr:hypothetical protein [Candidatus Thalassarchaeaceae archaeon]|tara:strand:- start:1088 stop:1228 length:141 start_codon:yes stop_codon:yes gene_type:complete